MKIKLDRNESIRTAFAEPARGPGWSNQPIWVIIRTVSGFREECIQPEEQTPDMQTLYDVSAAAHKSMVQAVQEKEDKS